MAHYKGIQVYLAIKCLLKPDVLKKASLFQ